MLALAPTLPSLEGGPRCGWSSLAGNLYANPPFVKISLVLAKIATERATVTLILPVWQDQAWWPTAVALPHEVFLLPRSAGLFEPGRNQLPSPRPQRRAAVFRFQRGGRPLPTRGVTTNAPSSSMPLAKTALPPLLSPTYATCP